MSSNLIYRADDNLEILKTRLKKHEEEISDILVFYDQKNILHSINGTDSIDFINRKIESIVKSVPNMLT
jgi:adenylate kinase family enzyme